jgi:hypothetical protein
MADPAIVGTAHVGYARVGVKGPIYLDDLIKQLENQPTSSSSGGGTTETILIWDEGDWDECFWA